ncbi:MAG: hypothetical protein ACLFP8_00205 [Alphaproteobacteria bacterium]
MNLIIKILLAVFVLAIIGAITLIMVVDVEIPQNTVVKTVPNEKILDE